MATDKKVENINDDEEELLSRRDFLIGLKKWSKIVVGGVVLGGLLVPDEDAEAGRWINRRGGGGWGNRRGGGGTWANRPYGGGWANRRGGGGWANRRGGGGWANRRW